MTPTGQRPTVDIRVYHAFAAEPGGGNPAGIVLDASTLTTADMLDIARDVGYSETVFATHTPTAATTPCLGCDHHPHRDGCRPRLRQQPPHAAAAQRRRTGVHRATLAVARMHNLNQTM